MKMYFVFFLVFSSLLYFSCNEDNSVSINPETKKITLQKSKWKLVTDSTIIDKIKKNKFKTDSIVIGAYPCGVKDVYVWGTDHYEITNGKYLGILPQNFSQSSYNSYKNFYGFNQIIVASTQHISWALNAGYTRDFLMGNVNFSPGSVDQLGYLKYYYLDEPIERNGTVEGVRWLAQFIHEEYPTSLLMLGSYKLPTDWYDILTGTTYGQLYSSILNNASNTRMMCDQYYDGTVFYGPDQVPHWNAFKNSYGQSRVFTHWISGDIDGGEQNQFGYLLDAATNLGINNLWLFMGGSGNSSFIDWFCDVAHQKYWMNKYERRYCIEYRCSYSNPCECDPTLPDGWYIYKVWDLGQVRLASR